nr:phosphoglucosamine mutase [Kangiella sp. TOML190]
MRKYFGTDGIRGTVGQFPITPEFVLKLAWAAGKVLVNKKGSERGTVIIGKDTRISGYMFESVLEAGLTAAGVNSLLVGPMPTPAVAYLTRTFRADAAIVISASHNPFYDNGIKFFSEDGTKLPDEIELEIEAMLDQELVTLSSESLGKAYRIDDAAARYIEFCKASVPNDFSLKGKKIVVDCAHGAAYHIAPHVFEELGAEIIAMGVSPNGLNINQECGATDTQALAAKVLSEQADLGIALDGDADRVMMIDNKGNLINGDQLILLIAEAAQSKGRLQGGVVGTLMTNMAVENRLKSLEIPFVRAKVGDRYVMEALKTNGWTLGGESSGHVICLEHNTTGDGIIAALQVLRTLFEQEIDLYAWAQQNPLFPQSLVNVRVADAQRALNSSQLTEAIKSAEHQLAGQGRVLIRASGTEPLVRVMVEAQDQAVAKRKAQEIAALVT